MKVGRPRKVRMKKTFRRKRYGALSRGARNPKQVAATMGRRRVRRGRRK